MPLIHFAVPPETNTMVKSNYTLIENKNSIKNNQTIPKRFLVIFLCQIIWLICFIFFKKTIWILK